MDIPILSGHYNQNCTKAHATWKRNARKDVARKRDGGASSNAITKKRNTCEDVEMRDLKKQKEVKLENYLVMESSVAKVSKD